MSNETIDQIIAAKTYKELEMIMKSSVGTSCLHLAHPFIRNFVITDGVKYFAEKAEAFWLCDVVASYIPKINKIDDYFFIVSMSVKTEDGLFKILVEEEGKRKAVVKQKIEYVDLPIGNYEFYLINDRKYFTLMCKSEY